MSDTIEKVSIIISKGSLEGIYPGLIMTNGARAEGIEANLFFTFFGLDAIHKARNEHIKLATSWQPWPAPGHHGWRAPRCVYSHDPLYEPQDGEARHPLHP